MRYNKWTIAAAATFGLFAATTSQASSLSAGDTVFVADIVGNANNPFDTDNLFRSGFRISNNGGAFTAATAGIFNLAYSHGDDGWTKFLAFCLEPTRRLRPFDPDGYAVTDNMNARISELFAEFYGAARSSATNAAAFQLAVWELAVDGAIDLASGNFVVQGTNTASNNAIALAASWLAALDGKGAAKLFVLNSIEMQRDGETAVQDLITVPEPGTLALLGLGLMGLGLGKRRRN